MHDPDDYDEGIVLIVNLAGYPGVQAGEERESGLGPLPAVI